MSKVFLDTNVILDYILDRYPAAVVMEEICEKCINEEIECYIAPHSLSNIFYILRNTTVTKNRRLILNSIIELCQVASVNKDTLKRAINDKRFEDFEDALQMACAEDCKAEVFITRDTKGFKNSRIAVSNKL